MFRLWSSETGSLTDNVKQILTITWTMGYSKSAAVTGISNYTLWGIFLWDNQIEDTDNMHLTWQKPLIFNYKMRKTTTHGYNTNTYSQVVL